MGDNRRHHLCYWCCHYPIKSKPLSIVCSLLLCVLLMSDVVDAFPITKSLLDQSTVISSDPTAFEQHQQQQQSATKNNSIIQSSFNFGQILKHDKRRIRMQSLKEALIYLRRYGYLNGKPLTIENVEHALRSFQTLAGIQASGLLNAATLGRMRTARCGNEDVEMSKRSNKHKKRFAQVSKWVNKMDRADVLRLKWFIENYSDDMPSGDTHDVVKKAFKLWAEQASLPSMRTVRLRFTEGTEASDSDINIKWAVGDHGDAYPFDDAGNSSNILAHTFYPNFQESDSLNGNIHFDDFEKWVLDAGSSIDQGVYFPYVLAHEIGHALGLGHSKRQEAIMNPIYKQTPLSSLLLDIDDKCAINWNYIGPSNTCLYVWLMVEFLPRAKEHSGTNNNKQSPPVGTSSPIALPPDPYRTNRVGELSTNVEETVDKLFDSLQNSYIPLCDDDNNVEFQYEEMLIKNLNFPRQSAHDYSSVVCRYAAGLVNVVNRRHRTITDNSYVERTVTDNTRIRSSSAGPLQMTVHSYRSSPFSSDQFDYFHHQSDDVSDEQINSDKADKEQIFDKEFFTNILKLFV